MPINICFSLSFIFAPLLVVFAGGVGLLVERTSTLTISGLTDPTDAGLYSCQSQINVLMTSYSQSAIIRLVVEGKTMTTCRDCTFLLIPPPPPPPPANAFLLSLPRFYLSSCLVLPNKAETSLKLISWLIYFSTSVPPEFTTTPNDVTIDENSTATFTCAVHAIPAVSFAWTGNDENITTGIANSSPAEKMYQSVLMVSNATVTDSGMYMCTATNNVSSASASAQLTVQSKF